MEKTIVSKRKTDNANVIMFPPLLYIIFLAAGLIISHYFPKQILSHTISLFGGLILLVLSLIILVPAVRNLVSHKTTVNPSGATTIIIKEGIYKFTRNPMYLAFTLFYLAISFLFNAWFSFVLFIPLIIIVQTGIIKREEKYLTNKFGDEYLSYKKNVRRWV